MNFFPLQLTVVLTVSRDCNGTHVYYPLYLFKYRDIKKTKSYSGSQ